MSTQPEQQLYRVTWYYRHGPSMTADRLFTWEEVEHEASFDDYEVTTTWEKVRG